MRMKWYCELSTLLLKENPDGGSFDGLRVQLKQRVIDLYKALLLYLIKSVCSCYRSRVLAFFRDTIKLDDRGNLKAVQDAGDTLCRDSDAYNNQQITFHLGQLVHITKDREMELLRDIRRTLQKQLPGQMSREDRQCIQDLRLTDPRHDKVRIEQTKGGLLADSYKWILDHPDFQK